MKVQRETDGSYLFTYEDEERARLAENKITNQAPQIALKGEQMPCLNDLEKYILGLVATFRAIEDPNTNFRQFTPDSMRREYVVVENLDNETLMELGYEAVCMAEVEVEEHIYSSVPPPSAVIELPPTEGDGVPLPEKYWDQGLKELHDMEAPKSPDPVVTGVMYEDQSGDTDGLPDAAGLDIPEPTVSSESMHTAVA